MNESTATSITALHIPEVLASDEQLSSLDAALAYAAAGFSVIPVRQGSKNPGSIVGAQWHTKSTRDPQEIASHWAGTDHGIALHAGRSGCVVFDVDHPENLPKALARHLVGVPFQATRLNQEDRGHYLFALPAGVKVGNGLGGLPKGWGDVRGDNGVIIVAPSCHESSEEGGCYRWRVAGTIPAIPEDLLAQLRPTDGVVSRPASSKQVRDFLHRYSKGGNARGRGLLGVVTQRMKADVDAGGSRHDAAVRAVTSAMEEASSGLYPTVEAVEQLRALFTTAKPEADAGEFDGIVAWAIAQAERPLTDTRRAARDARADRLTPLGEPGRRDHDTAPGATGKGGLNEALASTPTSFVGRTGLLARSCAKAVADDLGYLARGPGDTLWIYRDGVYVPDAGQVRASTTRRLGDDYRRTHFTNIEDILKGSFCSVVLPTGSDVPNGDYLNVENGLVEWRTTSLYPHSAAVASVHRLPVTYDPNADCPRIDAFLRDVFGDDDEVITFVEEVIGAVMYGGYPFHQRAVMLLGGGSNGKGVFISLLRALVGASNISQVKPQALDSDRFQTAELYGKLANIAGDVAPTAFLNTERLKEVIVGEMITAERKYGQPFDFIPIATVVAAFNEMPTTTDRSDGFFRRWIVLPFRNTFVAYAPRNDREKPRDPYLTAAITTPHELSGLLNRAVAGLQRLHARGGFDLPPAIDSATNAFREHADPVVTLLGDTYRAAADGFVSRTEFKEEYVRFCEEIGAKPLGAGRLYQHLPTAARAALGVTIHDHKRHGQRGFTGMARRDDA